MLLGLTRCSSFLRKIRLRRCHHNWAAEQRRKGVEKEQEDLLVLLSVSKTEITAGGRGGVREEVP
jgi:hypothetical protein